MSEKSTRPGYIYTFYSYKGGVGRSMALANIGCLLARWSNRVLLVDWDLEAPGLETFFGKAGMLRGGRADADGIVDLLDACAQDKQLGWRDCLLKVNGSGVTLDLISAGRLTQDYQRRVQSLDWAKLFRDHRVGNYIDRLRREWREAYDFVLVDSRTGITDIGDICTVLLPDALVLMFVSNHQNIDGIRDLMLRAREKQAQLPVDRSHLVGVPVPARDEVYNEYDKSQEWKRIYADKLGPLYKSWLPRGVEPSLVLEKLFIPYVTNWSFGERLPVVENPREIENPTSISAAYARLASLLQAGLDWSAVEGGTANHELLAARAERDGLLRAAAQRKKRARWLLALFVLLVALVLASVFVYREADFLCRGSPKCRSEGRCSRQGGSCIAASEADCRSSWSCMYWGQCTPEHTYCAATSEEDCRRSKSCPVSGLCTLKDGECMAVSEEDCRRSSDCTYWGRCTPDGRCEATSEDDCRRSGTCAESGKCVPKGGYCVRPFPGEEPFEHPRNTAKPDHDGHPDIKSPLPLPPPRLGKPSFVRGKKLMVDFKLSDVVPKPDRVSDDRIGLFDGCSDDKLAPDPTGRQRRLDANLVIRVVAARDAGRSGFGWSGRQCAYHIEDSSNPDLHADLRLETVPPFNDVGMVIRAGTQVYLNLVFNGYARALKDGNGNIVVGLDLATHRILWQSENLTSNANMLLLGGGIITGYGFSDEPDWLYVLDRRTGERVQRVALPKAPGGMFLKAGRLYVRLYDGYAIIPLQSPKLLALTMNDIVKAMKGVQPKIQDCANQFKQPGTASTQITVAPGGEITSVKVSGKFAGTPTGSCVAAAGKTAKLPACQPMTFPWPFTLIPR